MQLLEENVDYEFIATEEDVSKWRVRMLTGPYPETIISFGKVTAFENETNEDATLKFDFIIHYSPDEMLTDKDAGLQQAAGNILVAILESSMVGKEIFTTSEDK